MTRVCACKKNGTVICLYLISYFNEHVLLFEGCLLGLSLRICASSPWRLFAPWVTFVMLLEGWKFFMRGLSFVRSFVSWIRVVYFIGMRVKQPFTKISKSVSSLLLHHGWYDLSLLYWYALLIIPFLLSHHLHLVSHNFFLTIYSLFHHILTSIHLPDSTHFFTPFTWLVDGLNTSPPFTFHHWYSHQLFLSSHAHEIFLCVVHYTRGYGFDHWVFDPSFLSFLCLFTLA